MKVAILGATGMLGHKIYMTLENEFDVWAVARSSFARVSRLELFKEARYKGGLEAGDANSLSAILAEIGPDAIINCVGVTTRKIPTGSEAQVVLINAWLPHFLRDWAMAHKARLIHFSTDCVFSGKKGHYSEDDPTDARDLYGMSKALGEVGGEGILTIRSSIIGREIFGRTELVEWLISQKGKTVRGYRRAIYSGVTTNFMARFVKAALTKFPELQGVVQLASPPLSKFELLKRLNAALDLRANIEPQDEYVADKSLDGTRLYRALPGAEKAEWDSMMMDLTREHPIYEKWAAL